MKSCVWRGLLKSGANMEDLAKLSVNFSTCAIGEQLGFPKSSSFEVELSLTDKAKELGYDFHTAVGNGNREEALKILNRIERLKKLKE